MIRAKLWATSHDPQEALASLRRLLASGAWEGYEKTTDIELTMRRSPSIPTTWKASCTAVAPE